MFRVFLPILMCFTLGVASCADTSVDMKEDGQKAKTEALAEETSDIQGKTHDEAHDNHSEHDEHNEPRPYDAEADAWSDVNATILKAKKNDKLALIVMGANWCHDSRGLAAHFEDPEFRAANITPYFELIYVDVGEKNRNIDIAQSFGVDDIVGTPTVFIVRGDNEVLNLETAPTWRNAASRTREETAEYFKAYGEGELP